MSIETRLKRAEAEAVEQAMTERREAENALYRWLANESDSATVEALEHATDAMSLAVLTPDETALLHAMDARVPADLRETLAVTFQRLKALGVKPYADVA